MSARIEDMMDNRSWLSKPIIMMQLGGDGPDRTRTRTTFLSN